MILFWFFQRWNSYLTLYLKWRFEQIISAKEKRKFINQCLCMKGIKFFFRGCSLCSEYANEIKIEKKIKCIFRWLWSTKMVYTQLIELHDVINYMGSLDCHSSRVFIAFCFVSSQNCSTCLFQCLFFLWTKNKLTNMC